MEYSADPKEAVTMRGQAAATLASLPFWQDIREYLAERIIQAREQVQEAAYADPLVLRGLTIRWNTIQEFAQAIDSYPNAAIEGARELLKLEEPIYG